MLPRLKNKFFFMISVATGIGQLSLLAYISFSSSFSLLIPLFILLGFFIPFSFIPLGLLHRSPRIPIQMYMLDPLYYNLDPLPGDSGTNSDSGKVQTVDDEQEPEQLREKGETIATDGREASEESNLNEAIDRFSEALRYYRAAADKVDDPDREAEIETTVATLREDRNELKTQLESQTALNEALQAGEESFQEAIRAYVAGEQTLSRIRFRQARDRFEDASNTIKDSDTELLATPIIVAITTDRELPTMQLSDLRGFDSKTTATLESKGITTVSDLTEDDTETVVPDNIAEVSTGDALSESVTTKLTMLSWLHSQEKFGFRTKQDVAGRYKQAKRGFDEC
jgi:hypothetical protein